MKKTLTIATLLSLFTVPTFAQSFDPDVGTGNIIPLGGGMSTRRPFAGYIILRIDPTATGKGSTKKMPTTTSLGIQRRPQYRGFLTSPLRSRIAIGCPSSVSLLNGRRGRHSRVQTIRIARHRERHRAGLPRFSFVADEISVKQMLEDAHSGGAERIHRRRA